MRIAGWAHRCPGPCLPAGLGRASRLPDGAASRRAGVATALHSWEPAPVAAGPAGASQLGPELPTADRRRLRVTDGIATVWTRLGPAPVAAGPALCLHVGPVTLRYGSRHCASSRALSPPPTRPLVGRPPCGPRRSQCQWSLGGSARAPGPFKFGPGPAPDQAGCPAHAAGGGLTGSGQHHPQDSDRRARAAGRTAGPEGGRDSDLVRGPAARLGPRAPTSSPRSRGRGSSPGCRATPNRHSATGLRLIYRRPLFPCSVQSEPSCHPVYSALRLSFRGGR